MTQEVVLSTCSDPREPAIHVWELKSATNLAILKECNAAINTLSLVGDEYLIAAQTDRPALHIWHWRKDRPHFRCPMQERLSAVCVSNDGLYCVAGGLSGKLYLWEISTGTLLRIWEGHYKKVTCLGFTADDSFLLSGGEDCAVHCWSLVRLFEAPSSATHPSAGNSAEADRGTSVAAEHSWTDHTLPVTGVWVGAGATPRIATCSLDRCCRMYDMHSRALLCTIAFPTFLTAVTADPAEERLYVGGGDGRVFSIHLLSPPPATVGLEGAGDGMHTQRASVHILQGHTQPVCALAVSLDGRHVVSGGVDGAAKVWDAVSGQLVRTYTHHMGRSEGGAVTNVRVALRPVTAFSMTEKAAPITWPLAPFKKHCSVDIMTGGELQVTRLVPIRWQQSELEIPLPSLQLTDEEIERAVQQFTAVGSQGNLEIELQKARAEAEAHQEASLKWRQLANRLYRFTAAELLNSAVSSSEANTQVQPAAAATQSMGSKQAKRKR